MTRKFNNLSKAELLSRLQAMDQASLAQVDLQAIVHDLHVNQEEVRAQNDQLIEMKKSLERSRDRYADLYDFAPIAYMTFNPQGIVIDINLTGATLLGTERLRILGTPFLLYIEEPDRPAFLEHMRRCREGARGNGAAAPIVTELRLVARDGRKFVAQLLSRRSSNDADGSTSYRSALSDLTELKRAEAEKRELALKEQAARADVEARDRFMAILSHELRTPLTPVLAAVSALLERSNVSRSERPILEMIRRNIELEARLIEDLLDVTRITRNRLQLRVETVDIHTAIRDVLDMCAQEAHAKSLKLSSELRARKQLVRGDPARLRQIIWNLLKNAVKFTPAGGLVILRTYNPSPSRVALHVIDTGIGIQPDVIGKLFSAFEQDDNDRRRYGGLGLGLTISKSLVEAHAGTISASSDGKGRGATFVVELSTAPADAAVPDAPSNRSEAKTKSLRILLVEDHIDTAQLLCRLLENEGHRVRVATNVGDALKLSADGPMDLIISDLGLPDGTGYDLMNEMRPKLPAPIPAIALSGYGADADIKRSHECGFAEHITKPVDFNRLLDAIDQVTRA
ncbi:MAG TPA: ATP-binding protein [Tepidisphaeraceae bacterium]|jgi:PAS domain S-box-containing protein|nr:ATP-binding protein [Tepidisphaeraceae bacterium]